MTASEDTLETTSVMVLVPVKRHEMSSYEKRLKTLQVKLNVATANVLRLKPIDRIYGLRTKLPSYSKPDLVHTDLDEAGWRSLVARYKTLWYVRRRNLNYKEEVVGESIRILTDEFEDETDMRRYLRTLDLYNRFSHLKTRGSAAADLAMVKLLSSPKFTESNSLLMDAMRELEAVEKLDEKAVLEVAARFNEKDTGEGTKRVEKEVLEAEIRDDGSTIKAAIERNKARVIKLGDTKAVPELDYIARALPEEEFKVFAEEVKVLLDDKEKPAQEIAKVILEKKRSLQQ